MPRILQPTPKASNSRSGRGRGRARRSEPGREFVQGIERGFAVIRSFGSEQPRRTIADVADLTGLTRAVARRYLLTLLKLGYVVQDDSDFTLAPRISELGFAYLSTMRLLSVASPFMEQLVARLHESCSVSVLDGQEIVCVAGVSADRLMSSSLIVGSRHKAHATAAGKVLLAHLSTSQLNKYLAEDRHRAASRGLTNVAVKAMIRNVRERGWAIADGELEEGVRDVAVPIIDQSGRVAAALSVNGNAARASVQQLKRIYLPPLAQIATEISKALERPVEAAIDTEGATART